MEIIRIQIDIQLVSVVIPSQQAGKHYHREIQRHAKVDLPLFVAM